MVELSQARLERIAFHLLTFKNPSAKRRLYRSGISPERLWRIPRDRLATIGYTPEEISLIQDSPMALAEAEVRRLKKTPYQIIFQDEEDFPPLLRQIGDPPELIYLAGNLEKLGMEKIAIVGSRRGGSYGQRVLKQIVPDLCRAGFAVVSGMAYGIDSMAHGIALDGGGVTIGVNAGGLLHLYPSGNMTLIKKILDRGAIISEFPLDTVPRPYLFPIRNRIISGLSRAVLVVEATFSSGSLITAKLGLEQNREIMAVPGSIDSPLSTGTHYLIQQGAKLIHSSQDILDEFGIKLIRRSFPPPALSVKEKKILDLLGSNEVQDMDSLVEVLNLSPAEVISLLMGLVMKNLIIEESGFYTRTAHAQ